MWAAIKKHFCMYPAQEKVARLLLRQGLSVKDKKIYSGEIEIPAIRIARALDIDRRAVGATIETISRKAELRKVYSSLCPVAYLKPTAQKMGWSVIQIIPTDPSLPGILAGVANIISKEGVQIRQAITEDPELAEEATMTLITEKPIPSGILPRLKRVKGVKSILLL